MKTMLFFAGITLVFIALLYFLQEKMIYFPRQYNPNEFNHLTQRIAPLTYDTAEGEQMSFYFPPMSGGEPESIWILSGGNATLALEWFDFAVRFPEKKVGFLFFEYPGYGRSKGSPQPKSIRESLEKAYIQLGKHLGKKQD